MIFPVLLAIVLTVAWRRPPRLLSALHRERRPDAPAIVLTELTALGLSAGLGFTAAVEAASTQMPEDEARQIRRRLRSGAHGDTPEFARELFSLSERAEVTGAPLLASVDGYALSLRRQARADAVAKARRLPVKLLFPLALLILPGFLLLTVAPAFMAGIDRLL